MKDEPINSHCPWSGKPISLDSTLQYRGQTVAFCNPDCRDKFATAMKLFDAAIEEKSHAEPILQPTRVSEYSARAMRFDQILTLNDLRLKLYHITTSSAEPIQTEVANQAIAYVRDHLPEKTHMSGGAHGVGYVVLHRGVTDHWLLMHWWGGGDICLSSMARLKGGSHEFEGVDDQFLHACVWEHVVIAHERDAWVRTMMNPAPSLEGYLADRLADGVY